jgi:hypothetical protein
MLGLVQLRLNRIPDLEEIRILKASFQSGLLGIYHFAELLRDALNWYI